jgi:hypothetical protein
MADADGIVVRMDPQTRHKILGLTAAIVAVVVIGVALSLAGVIRNPHPRRDLLALVAVFLAGAALQVFVLLRARVVLYPDRLEVMRGLLPARSVPLAGVVGWTVIPAGYRRPPRYVLVLQDDDEVWLPPYLERNAAFRTWLARVPRPKTGHGDAAARIEGDD